MVAVFAAGFSSLSAQQSVRGLEVARSAVPAAIGPTRDWRFGGIQPWNTNTFSTRGLQSGAEHSRAVSSNLIYWMLVNDLTCRTDRSADCPLQRGPDPRTISLTPRADAPGSIFAGPDRPAPAPAVTTPEPITLLLVGSGLAGIGAVARRGRLNQKSRHALE
ncbi:MAG TPA: PEP-CTERM sorting domain-containing protein [Longimicrobiales bacterium]|nr:PEP-CTERM sorting domain-containing protein [Longimicrobiales bacterium]